MVVEFARKCMKKIYTKSYSEKKCRYTYQIRKDVLDRFEEPENRIQASWFQYSCQMTEVSLWLKIIQNFVAVPLLLKYAVSKKTDSPVKCMQKDRACYLSDGINLEIIPDSLLAQFKEVVQCNYSGEVFLGDYEWRFIKKNIFRYMKSPFFVLKSIVKIGLYANYIYTYSPIAIITYSEYSFTSSLLTEYCEQKGIRHINVMHGEKLYNVRDAFCEFHQYYVWDSYYVQLMADMKIKKEQMIVEFPQRLLFAYEVDENEDVEYDYTYYLGGESSELLHKKYESLKCLKLKGKKVCVRMHPRFSDEKVIRAIFKDICIENPLEITLKDSFLQTKGIIAISSTILYQAYKNGKQVILDDVSDPLEYSRLDDLKYIMMDKPHVLLSSLIN